MKDVEEAAAQSEGEVEMLRSAEAAQRNRADELQARVDEFEAKREELVEAYSAMVDEVTRLRALEHERNEMNQRLQQMELRAETERGVARRLKGTFIAVGALLGLDDVPPPKDQFFLPN